MVTFRLSRFPCLPVQFSAGWATSLRWYGRLPAMFAEAGGFRLAAVLSGACPSSFLSFLCGEADSLWLLGCFRLCGLGRRGFRGFRGASECRFWICRLPALGFGLWIELIGGIGGHRELEFPLKGCAYCPLVRAILVYGKQSWVGEMSVADFARNMVSIVDRPRSLTSTYCQPGLNLELWSKPRCLLKSTWSGHPVDMR